jgi:hypothetical protein
LRYRAVNGFDQFHDGFYNGLLIRKGSVDLFVETSEKERFVLSASGVEALLSGGIREGNIIFDIECRAPSEITLGDIREINGFADGPRDEAYAQKAMAKVANQNLSMLVMSSSYGGDCLLLAKSFVLQLESHWIRELCTRDGP